MPATGRTAPLAAILLAATTALAGIPSCTEANLEECIKDNVNNYILQSAKGWSGKLNGLDPLLVPAAGTSYQDGNASVSINFKNVVITGIATSRISIVRAKRSLEEGKIELVCKTPTIIATGVYNSEGVVITFPLHSYGPFNITLGDLTSHFIVNLERKKGNLQVKKIVLNVMPSTIDVQAGQQLDGDNNLGVTLNLYLNENSFELYNIVRPQLMDFVSNLIKDFANEVLMEVQLTTIFPDLHLKR